MQNILDIIQHFLDLVRHHNVHDLIREIGYWFYPITFVWTALEGETFVIFAALAAQRGFLNIWALFASAWFGSFFGDQIYFFLGRKYGTRIIARYPKLQPKLNKVFGWLEKYATVYILSYRFMYGIRNVSGVAVGMSKLPWRKFVWLNLLASFLWSLAFCGAGYLFGDVIARFGRHKDEVVDYSVREIMLSALVLFALVIIIRLLFLQWQRKREEQLSQKNQDVQK